MATRGRLKYVRAVRSLRPSRGTAVLIIVVVLLAGSAVRVLAQDDHDDGPERSAVLAARELLVEVDRTELCHWQRHGRYSDSIAELQLNAAKVKGAEPPGADIMLLLVEHGLDLTLDAGRDGKSYIQRITGNGVDTYFERRGTDSADYGDLAWGHVKQRCEP
jgi:hypothetical protein